MPDLVKRLREDGRNGHNPLCLEAADSIEALEAALKQVERETVERIVAWLGKTANMNPQTPEASAFVLLLCKAIEAKDHLK